MNQLTSAVTLGVAAAVTLTLPIGSADAAPTVTVSARQGADDGPLHDVGDDHGGRRGDHGRGADDGVDHDRGDDHGRHGRHHGRHGNDDGVDHDRGDDHGGDRGGSGSDD